MVDIVVLPGGTGVNSNVCDRIKMDENGLRFKLQKLFKIASKVLTVCTGSFIIPTVFNSEEHFSKENLEKGKSVDGRPVGN